jgi:hypothetical protein
MGSSLVVADETLEGDILPPPTKLPTRSKRFTEKQIEEAIVREGGLVSAAARYLEQEYDKPCTAGYLRRVIRESPHLMEVKEDIVEDILDQAEANLLNQLTVSDVPDMNPAKRWATEFTLKTLGKNRGYGYRVEHTGKDGTPLEIVIKGDDARL